MQKNNAILKKELLVDETENTRIDIFLKKHFPDHSRSYFQYLIEKKAILLNGSPLKKKDKVKLKDIITINFLKSEPSDIKPQKISLDIIYEDDYILAINKPAGLVVHPGAGNWQSTIANGLLYYYDQLKDDSIRPGIVHRLDKNTSGVLIAAKKREAQEKMALLFKERKIKKEYICICINKPKEGILKAPIKRHPKKRKEMAVLEGGKEAISDFQVIKYNKKLSLVKVNIHSGRTHQIRVHLKHLNSPVLGDDVYGNKKLNKQYQVKRQLLHASLITFIHPYLQKKILITAPTPQDIQNFIFNIEK